MTAPAAVPDDVVAQLGPVSWGEECGDCNLDLVGVGLGGPFETADQPSEVGIDSDAGNAETVAEYHVGGLAADAGESHQVFHPLRHFTAKALGQCRAKLDQGVGLGSKEARGLDQLLQFLPVGSGVRGGVGIAGEYQRRDQVDPLVGALCRQNGGNEQLQRVGEIELNMGVGIGGRQDAVHSARAAYQCCTGLVVDQSYGRIRDIGSQLGCAA